MKMKNRPQDNRVRHYKGAANNIFFSTIFIILALYAASMLVLLIWAFITSLRDQTSYLNDPFGWPTIKNMFQNYIDLFRAFRVPGGKTDGVNNLGVVQYFSATSDVPITHYYDAGFFDMMLNSLIYAGVGSLIQAFVPAIVAYILCKYKFKFSKFLYGVALLTYIIPIIGNYPAVLKVMQDLQLYDSFIGNFIQKFNFGGMYFFIYYAFFEGISDSYIEAAELDGANQFQILTRVILPQARTIIFTVVVILFVQLWNDYQTPLLYLPSKPTIAYGVHYIAQKPSNDGDIINFRDITRQLAASMSLAIPVLLLFIFLKEKLMTNLSMGGVKE